ncbi:hypothetical protein [Spirosoma linguale]
MLRSHYAYIAILILFAFPVFYMIGARFFNYVATVNIGIIYLAVFFSGPCLLGYGYVMRKIAYEKTVSLIALILGGLWTASEIVIFIKGAFFR